MAESAFLSTSVRYCTHLGRNVIVRVRPGLRADEGCECLNKPDCGYYALDCRNRLMGLTAGRRGEDGDGSVGGS